MSEKCVDHLDFCGKTCPDCGEEIDEFGNSQEEFRYCVFPNCGCDGSRLCMATEGASDRAFSQNVEGMWNGKKPEQIRARMDLAGSLMKERNNEHG